jgi:hypothetical protein
MDELASPAGTTIDSEMKLLAKDKSNHVMVWRFADAPYQLRLLHPTLPSPEWLVLVPHARIGSDLDELITGAAESIGVFRYDTPAGDVVYTGSSAMNKAGNHLRTAKAELAASIPLHA